MDRLERDLVQTLKSRASRCESAESMAHVAAELGTLAKLIQRGAWRPRDLRVLALLDSWSEDYPDDVRRCASGGYLWQGSTTWD